MSPGPPEHPDPLAHADVLEREITALCAQITAGYRLLRLIAELDDLDPWGAWGLVSCAHWLNWRCGIGLNAAREEVRVVHALERLPLISATFAAGELSFSKVRTITRIAAAENEAELLELARHATAAQVEKLVRAYRRVGRVEERERAEALTAMVETALSSGPASGSAANRYQVVVHITAETLAADADADGRCELECGPRLAPDTARRIACDGSLLRITGDAAGNPLDIGRKTRAVPPAIRRALQLRDGGCRFPGCTRHRYVGCITSATGRTAATRRWTISCCFAAVTTGSCTRVVSASSEAPTAISASVGRTGDRSNSIRSYRSMAAPKACWKVIARPEKPSTPRRGSFLTIRWTTVPRSKDCCASATVKHAVVRLAGDVL